MPRPSLLLCITFVNTFSSVKYVVSKGKKVIAWNVVFLYYTSFLMYFLHKLRQRLQHYVSDYLVYLFYLILFCETL